MKDSFKIDWIKSAEKDILDLQEDILTGIKEGLKFEADEELIQRVMKLEPKRVLDFGCGLLRNFNRLKQLTEVWGYDSAVMLAKTQQENTTDNWDFLRQMRFDVTLACICFQHIEPNHLVEYLQSIALNSRYLVVAGRNCFDDMKTIVWPYIDTHFTIVEEYGNNWDSTEPFIYNCRIYQSKLNVHSKPPENTIALTQP